MRTHIRVVTATCAALCLACHRPAADTGMVTPDPSTPGMTPGSAGEPRAQLYAMLAGRWRGSLEYKDYRDAAKRVTLPTVLDVSTAPDASGLLLRFVYDDGPGKTVVEHDVFTIDGSLTHVTWRSGADHVQGYAASSGDDRSAAARTVVLEGAGRDDDRPAALRETVVVDGGTLRILKEVRFDRDWEFRHEYRFTRER